MPKSTVAFQSSGKGAFAALAAHVQSDAVRQAKNLKKSPARRAKLAPGTGPRIAR